MLYAQSESHFPQYLNNDLSTKNIRQTYIRQFIGYMKNCQHLHLRPNEAGRGLSNERPSWSKSNLSMNHEQSSKRNRTKSPIENIRKSLQVNPKKDNLSRGKENQKNVINQKGNKSSVKAYSTVNHPKHDRNQYKIKIDKAKPKNHEFKKIARSNSVSGIKRRYNSLINIEKRQRSLSTDNVATCKQSAKKMVKKMDKKIKISYSYRTREGYQSHNPAKVNQDSLIVKNNLGNKGINLFAVADGHGSQGHFVSKYLVNNIVKAYESELNSSNLLQSIPRVFDKLQKGLTNSQINASCSGSTLVNILIEGDQIICANVGDSRAILARQIDKKSWELIYLSQDHKPSIDCERKRILKEGGRIHAFKDEKGHSIGPLRVWLPNQNIQGLAMSRSFGDNVSKTIGVIHDPEIIRVKLDKRDKFILLASDGVWEFINNQQVLQLLVPYYKQNKLEEACEALSKLAYERWTRDDKSIVDDITLVLIFLSND